MWSRLCIFSIVFLSILCDPDVHSQNVDVSTLEAKVENEGLGEISISNTPGKGEKLEEEIEQIGKVMQPETVAVKHVSDIPDDVDLSKKKLDNFTVTDIEVSTTEAPTITVAEPSIDAVGEGLENDEQGEPEDSEHLRHPSENFIVELSEKLKDNRKHHDDQSKAETYEATDATAIIATASLSQEAYGPQDGSYVATQITPKVTQINGQDAPESFVSDVSHVSDVATVSVKKENEAEVKEIESKEAKDADNVRITWDLIHFLLLLSPYDEDEVTWWTIVFEAVRCSLRNCPNENSYWHHTPMHLPRITRHRRHGSNFYSEEILRPPPSSTTPCPCRNLKASLERLYESMEKANIRKEREASGSAKGAAA